MQKHTSMLMGLYVAMIVASPADVAVARDFDPREWPRVEMQRAEVKPPRTARRHVVVLPFGSTSVATANASGVSEAAQVGVENTVEAAGAIVVDRSMYGVLVDEIAQLESTGISSLQIEGATDAIKGTVTSAGVTHKWTRRSENVAAYCVWTAEVRGRNRLYNMNPLQLRKTVYFGGRATSRRDTGNSGCPISAGQATELLLQAARNAGGADCAKVALKNEFGPIGYVKDYRKKNKSRTSYFRTTLTDRHGAANGKVAVIIRQTLEEDYYDDSKTLETRVIATGKIKMDSSGVAWIEVRDAKSAKKVRGGDLARLNYKKASAVSSSAKKIKDHGIFGILKIVVDPLLGNNFDACAAVN